MVEVETARPFVRPADKRPASVELRAGMDFRLLAAAYYRWHAEGLFHLIFHRCPQIGLVDFLDWNFLPTVDPVGCFVGDELIGVGWIVQARKVDGKLVAEVGAAFFRGAKLTAWRKSIELLVSYTFDRGCAEIYGLCAHGNRFAKLLTRAAGMTRTDRMPWPDESPGDVYVLSRRTWERSHLWDRAALTKA